MADQSFNITFLNHHNYSRSYSFILEAIFDEIASSSSTVSQKIFGGCFGEAIISEIENPVEMEFEMGSMTEYSYNVTSNFD